MAFITPNGNVKLLTGVPINVDYENTLYFASRSAQYTYFASKVKTVGGVPCSYTDISYQRYQKNSIKLQINADLIYDCNYMMFQNTNFGNRWFYAFITGIEYVANQVTRIDYAIDDIQTWLLDCELLPSYVERQHSLTDALQTSFTDEPFGDMNTIVRDKVHRSTDGNCLVVFLAKKIVTLNPGTGEIQSNQIYFDVKNGVGDGFYTIVYDITWDDPEDIPADPEDWAGMTALNNMLNNYNMGVGETTPEDVVAIIEMDKSQFKDSAGVSTLEAEYDIIYGNHYEIVASDTLPGYLGNMTITMPLDFKYYKTNTTYTPKNKKLLQYPFTYLVASDCRSQEQVFDPLYMHPLQGAGDENFYTIQFYEWSVPLIDPCIMVAPKNYGHNLDDGFFAHQYAEKEFSQDYTMIVKNGIHCAWLSDTFKAWLAQNGGIVPVAYNLLKEPVADAAFTIATGGMGVPKLLDSTINSMQSLSMATHQPNHVHGNYNADIQVAAQFSYMMYITKQIPAELAERIDMFFQMYGYAEKNVVVPNISSRPKWNYVKTNGLNINATIPEDATNHIISIFSNGIRFWKNPAEVGRYNLDNSPS